MMLHYNLRLACLLLFLSVLPEVYAQGNSTLFRLLTPEQSGINFSNTLTENDTVNILNHANIYNGGGVGVGDFNNDGLPDIYFAGNMVEGKLYLNKGSMQFDDRTREAGVTGQGRWCTGVSVVDINGDGWLDMYLSASFWKDPLLRTNVLYINQGLDKNGIPVFKDMAKAYGLADTGYSTNGYFFDYDRDGDLDMYLVTNDIHDPKTPIRFRPKVTDGTASNTDRLYRNNGNGTFSNVSAKAGILIEGWGHAACISDFNMDGWPDIYVANDFVSNDVLYINNRNGTFSNRIGKYFKHTGWNAMGSDAVDINNDGLVDLISLEMLPESNMRKKRMLSGNEYYNYFNSSKFGYEHQYVRNVLQLNSGMTAEGHPVFSDVGFLSDVYQTDWSWCPLVADFDNDGFRDIIITNGLPRDVTDLDYIAYDNGQGGGAANLSLAMAQTLPVVNIPNYSYRNKGGILFENTSKDWGFTQSSFSNGGIYADLDNDGDLDVAMNNINGLSVVYENTSNSKGQKKGHSLAVTLVGNGLNKGGIGARLHLYYKGEQQVYEHQPCRGYLSTVDARAHFGVGAVTTIDSIHVFWPDGKSQLLTNIPVDQSLTIRYSDAVNNHPIQVPQTKSLFTNVAKRLGIRYKPQERDFIDYTIQATLPHKLSQYGPGIAVGDIDQNGFEDFYLGGTSGNPGKFFMQNAKGSFLLDSTRIPRSKNELEEEMGVLLFDADNDGDLDLYTVSGSYEIPPGHAVSQDRLFINDGKGKYLKANSVLPSESTNGSCVRAADFDSDGDLDLFVGGRVVSGAYPTAPNSYIFRNDGGSFVDVTGQYCAPLQNIGMVTDALWTDFDNDNKVDLVITGEWMPVTFFKNTGSSFVPVTTNIQEHVGWWNSLVSGDFDNDGDMDYVAGNLGLNSNYRASPGEPLTIMAKDMDKNGSLDAMVFCYMLAEDSTRKPYPMHTKDDLTTQLISTRKKFPTYKSYGLASMNDFYSSSDRLDAIVKSATDLASGFLENKGNGQFEIKPLPVEAQAAPVYGMLSEDVDQDGNLDLLLVGNDHGMDPYSGRHDAFNGLYLKGDGKGSFSSVPVWKSGFLVKGDAKGLAKIHSALKEDLWIATQNQDSLLVFRKEDQQKGASKWIQLKMDDLCADIIYKDGKRRKVEFYYGTTFLSQSSRKLLVEKDASKITITNYKGQKRTVL